MNILAHRFLSGNYDQIAVGNFIADSLRGTHWPEFTVDIKVGIALHRFIDHFTDTHPVVSQLNELLKPHFGRYAPVATDILFDHILAKNWAHFHPMPLADFTQLFYKMLFLYEHHLPERGKRMLKYMSGHDWLLGYASKEGIEMAFHGMSRRARFATGFEEGRQVLILHESKIEDAFFQFFPDIQEASSNFLATQHTGNLS